MFSTLPCPSPSGANTSRLTCPRQYRWASPFGRPASEHESATLDGSDELPDPADDKPRVHKHIQVRGHPQWFDATPDGVDEHHLTPDECLLLGSQVSEFEEGFPQSELIPGEGR